MASENVNAASIAGKTYKLRITFPLVCTLLAFIAVYGPTLKWLWERWMMGVWHNAHGVLIPFASAYLIRHRLKSSGSLINPNGSNIGYILLSAALLLHIVDTVIWSQILSAISIVPAVIGLSLIFIGFPATRSIWLPLLLLIFMIPIPSGIVQPLVVVMRSITAIGASLILDVIGIPLIRTGTNIEIPNAVVNVANACSGLATFSATMAFTVALLWFWPARLRTAAVLLAAALPVALAANIVRNCVLILLAYYKGVHILDSFWHPFSGYAMYIIAISIQTFIYNATKKETTAECPPAEMFG